MVSSTIVMNDKCRRKEKEKNDIFIEDPSIFIDTQKSKFSNFLVISNYLTNMIDHECDIHSNYGYTRVCLAL